MVKTEVPERCWRLVSVRDTRQLRPPKSQREDEEASLSPKRRPATDERQKVKSLVLQTELLRSLFQRLSGC